MKIKIHLAFCLLFSLFCNSLSAQSSPSPWALTCDDGVEVEVIGIGLSSTGSSSSLPVLDPSNVQQVIVEAVCKFNCPPSVDFSNGTQTVTAMAAPLPFPRSTFIPPARVYRASFSSVSSKGFLEIQGANSFYFLSMTAYLFRTGTGVNQAGVGLFVDKSFYQTSDTFTVAIPKGTSTRDVTIRIPVTDLNNDTRVGTYRATIGGKSEYVTLMTADPALGQSLAFAVLRILNVAANDTTIEVIIESPANGGDSFMIGGAISVDITCDNKPPIAIDDILNTLIGIPAEGNVLTNDYDPEDDPIMVNPVPVSSPSNGTLVLNNNGTYTYTPGPGFVGTDRFSYEVCDNQPIPGCDTADVVIEVRANTLGNNQPFANDDQAFTHANQPVDGHLLTNDGDPDGDLLIINTTPISGPSNGTVTINANGTFTYTPNAGFEGEDSFTYEICDDGTPSLCDQAVVTVRVAADDNGPQNDPPFAGDDAIVMFENQEGNGDLSLNDSDPNGNNLDYNTTPVKAPLNGTVIINADGTFTYTPNAGYTGPDNFIYEVCDDGTPSLCVKATAYVTVMPDNYAPNAINDINNTLLDIAVDGNVLTNDFDIDGDVLSVLPTMIASPVQGSVVLNANGDYTYTPNPGFVGTDGFVYVVCDNGEPGPLCDTAKVIIEVRATTLGNEPPVANDDDAVTQVGQPVSGNLLSNDFDPDGDPLTLNITPISGPFQGSVVVSTNGDFTYTPNPGYVGTDGFVYEVCDNGTPSLCDRGVVAIQILEDLNGPDNDPPFAGDDAIGLQENSVGSGDLSTNDSDPNGDFLTYTTTPVAGPTNGTVVINTNGTFTYTPNADYFGPDKFVYEVCDNGTPSLCAVATAYLSVYPINAAPSAKDDINITLADTPVEGNVLTNDTDPDGDNLSANTTPVSGPSNGTLVLNPDGSYTYTPNLGFNGTDMFMYEVCDEGIPGPLCDTATVTIEVRLLTGGNNAPVANNDVIQTRKNTPKSGNLLSNDFDPDGDALTINQTPLSGPSNGTVVILTTGGFLYIPNSGFEGEDSFVYEICDSGSPSLCDQATAFIFVASDPNGSDNDPPFAVDDVLATKIGEAAGGDLSLNDSDPNGDNLDYNTTPLSGPSNGTVVINMDGTYSYAPNPGYFGPDNFVYEVCDDGTPSLCSKATAYIVVLPVNEGPIATNDVNITLADMPTDGNVLINDWDPDGNDLTVNTSPLSGPSNGILVLNMDGTYTYTPNPGFDGKDSFVYEVCDNGIPGPLCATAEVTINVRPLTPGNEAPIANDDEIRVRTNTPTSGNFINNDFDPDGDFLTVNTTPISGPSHGSVIILTSGGFLYLPNSGYEGTDSFVYEICDTGTPSLCDQATVTITISSDQNGSDNDPPFAGDDAVLTQVGVPVGGFLSQNDTDPNGDNLDYTTTPIEGPFHGTVNITALGTFVYTPDAGYLGPDYFSYEVCDDGTPSLCAQATAYVLVVGENTPPVATNDINNTLIGFEVDGNVLTNDVDPDGDDLIVNTTPISGPSNGTLVLNSDGTYTYTPNTGFTGTDIFVYEVCDNGVPAYCDTASVTIEVRDNTVNNDPPIANNDEYRLFVNAVISGNLAANDIEPNGDPISITGIPVVNPSHGIAILNANGTFIYIPDLNFEGEDTFIYEVCDNGSPALCDVATVTLIVSADPNGPANDPPFAGDDALRVPKNGAGGGNLASNDSDPNGDALTYNTTPIDGPLHGTVVMASNGLYSYTPDPGYVGPDRFVYEVCDNGSPSLCAYATAYISVMPDVAQCVDLNVAAFLEGAYDMTNGKMSTTLNSFGYLPGQTPAGLFPTPTPHGQPYNVSPWLYDGDEGDNYGDQPGNTAYASTVTDWVLISIRQGDNKPNNEIFKQAALLHDDGSIEFVGQCFATTLPGPYWIIVEHRNHVGVMSHQPVPITTNATGGLELNYDFRIMDSFSPLFAIGQKLLDPARGHYAMLAGDTQKTGNENFEVNGNDNTVWLLQNGSSEKYSTGDINLDVEVNGNDRSVWLRNNGSASGVPK